MASKAKINTILTSVCPECKHCTLDEQWKHQNITIVE